MTTKPLLALLAVLSLTLTATSLVADEPSELSAQPATPGVAAPAPALEPALLPPLDLAEALDIPSALMSLEVDSSTSAGATVLAPETSWYRGICWTSCYPCSSSAQCPWGESCQFGVQCP